MLAPSLAAAKPPTVLAAIGLANGHLGSRHFGRRTGPCVTGLNTNLALPSSLCYLVLDSRTIRVNVELGRRYGPGPITWKDLATGPYVALQRSLIPHRFSKDYYENRCAPVAQLWEERLLCRPPELGGTEHLEEAARNKATIIYACNHRSQVDYIFLGMELFRFAKSMRERGLCLNIHRYVADTGLYVPFLTWDPLNLGLAYFDFRKAGAIGVSRILFSKKTPDYMRDFQRYVDWSLGIRQNLLFFPSGGRSYDGSINEFKKGIVRCILKTCNQTLRASKGEFLLVPTAISYDRTPEDTNFPHLIGMKSRRPRPFWYGAAFLKDIRAISSIMQPRRGTARWPSYRGSIECFIEFGDPIDVSDYRCEGEELEPAIDAINTRCRQAIIDGVVITASSLVAHAFFRCRSSDSTVSQAELEDVVTELKAQLSAAGRKLDHAVERAEASEIIDRALLLFTRPQGSIMEAVSHGRVSARGERRIRAVDQTTMRYYANMVADSYSGMS